MYQGVIFDLDGVICTTDEFHYLAWKALADKEGIPFDRETNNLLRGVSRMASLEIILVLIPMRKKLLLRHTRTIYIATI